MCELRSYFKKIHNQLDASFNRVLRNYGLTGTQFDVLAYLADHDRSKNTLTDIAAYFSVKHTSVIHVLKILEKKKLIEKEEAPDTRAKKITLTDQGVLIITEVRKRGPFVSRLLFAGLSENELMLLEKMLKQIYTNIESEEFQNL